MRTVAIPGTALRPSALCLGTALFGSDIPRQASFALMDLFLEGGGTFLDTASCYADWLPGERSASEKTIGLWLREKGGRDRIVLATKGGHPDRQTRRPRLSREEIETDLAGSLRNLQTDVIDLYWLHRDDEERPIEEIMATLNAHVRAGRIRYAGCSNWKLERLRAAQETARRDGWIGFVANQMMWSLARLTHPDLSDPTMVVMDDALHAYHRDAGLAAAPYTSQANGWFQKRERRTGPADPAAATRYDTPLNEARAERVSQLASESGLSVTQIVLGYLLSQPFPTFPIFGSRNPAHLQDTLTAGDTLLTPSQLAFLTPDAHP